MLIAARDDKNVSLASGAARVGLRAQPSIVREIFTLTQQVSYPLVAVTALEGVADAVRGTELHDRDHGMRQSPKVGRNGILKIQQTRFY